MKIARAPTTPPGLALILQNQLQNQPQHQLQNPLHHPPHHQDLKAPATLKATLEAMLKATLLLTLKLLLSCLVVAFHMVLIIRQTVFARATMILLMLAPNGPIVIAQPRSGQTRSSAVMMVVLERAHFVIMAVMMILVVMRAITCPHVA